MVLASIIQIVEMLANILIMLIIVQFVIGLLMAFNVVDQNNQFFSTVYRSINALLDPILAPIRRILPSTGAIDFSPLVLIIGINILLIVLGNIYTASLT